MASASASSVAAWRRSVMATPPHARPPRAVNCTVNEGSHHGSHGEETANTLKFAQRAKKVVQRGSDTRDSIVDTSSLLAHYRAQIDALKADLAAAQEKATVPEAAAAPEDAAPTFPASPPPPPDGATEAERATLRGAVDQIERLILKSGERVPSPTALRVAEVASSADDKGGVGSPRFFGERQWKRARNNRARTLPPRVLAAANGSPEARAFKRVDDGADGADGDGADSRAATPPPPPPPEAPPAPARPAASRAKTDDDPLLRDLEGLLERGAALCASESTAGGRARRRRRGSSCAPAVSGPRRASFGAAAAAAAPEAPPPPPPPPPPSAEDDAVAAQLRDIKAAIERVLARGGSDDESRPRTPPPPPPPPPPEGGLAAANAALEADLDRAREDAAFVLSQLDKAEAENERLGAALARANAIVASREAELLAVKGLSSPEDETF